MLSHLPRGAHQALIRIFAELRRRCSGGEVVVGYHNSNYILPLGQPLAYLLGADSGRIRAKFRVPFETVEVVPRLWRESEVLRAVSPRLKEVPGCLADFGDWSVHAYLAGHVLSEETPKGPIGGLRMGALAELFTRLADVPEEELPKRPADWPTSGDSSGFLDRLASFAEQQVHQANRPRFGRLFDSVGVPRDAVHRFLRSVPELTGRPFAVLHTDIHRGNVVVTPGADGERLSLVDWELSLYGDPLHDLATHLVRMDYDETEQNRMTELWTGAMLGAGRADVTAGMDRDLPSYLGFEYIQSVFPDVMRAALALPDDPAAEDFARSADRVCRALRRAWGPLGLPDVPIDEPVAAEALRQWHADDRDAREAPAGPRSARAKGGVRRRRGAAKWWCAGADQPRGIPARRRGLPEREARETSADVGDLLEDMERYGC